jgi:hypothetical protein
LIIKFSDGHIPALFIDAKIESGENIEIFYNENFISPERKKIIPNEEILYKFTNLPLSDLKKIIRKKKIFNQIIHIINSEIDLDDTFKDEIRAQVTQSLSAL